MPLVQALLFMMIIIKASAIPRCTYFGQDKSNLVCLPNEEDTDFVLTRGLVTDNVNTKSVTMKNCKVSAVDCQAFQGLTNLDHLDLSENSIHSLKPCIFDNLYQLTSLNLSYNRISEIPNEFFNNANNIEHLDLKGNKINKIQPGLFGRLYKLNELDLSSNSILGSELGLHLFDRNQLLKSIDFSRNDMSGSPEDWLIDLQSLETLKLDRCFLTEIPSFATNANMKTLKVLILSTNQISSLNDPTVFVNLDNLEILNLAGNAIESIADHIFSPLRKVKTIVLKQNRLKQLPERLFQNMPKLVSVDLAYNVIEKIEVSPFRNTRMKNLNISGNKLTYLPENFCQQLRDSGGRLTKFLFTPNPWQCSCLRDIMEEVKALGLVYNSQRYDGKEQVCNVESGHVFECVRS